MISLNTKLFNRQNSMMMFLIISSTFLIFYISDVFAEVETQTSLTSDDSLNVKLEVIPPTPNTDDDTKFKIEFIDPKTSKTQVHVDYRVLIETQEKQIFETNLIHTSLGIVIIPYHFSEDGEYIFKIIVEGILFVPVPEETVSFKISVGDSTVQTMQNTSIPEWVKNNAGWWADNSIDDDSFIQGIQFLIKENILKIPTTTPQASGSSSSEIPEWVKNNAGWWAEGQIGDSDFVAGIKYLITNGIMTIQ